MTYTVDGRDFADIVEALKFQGTQLHQDAAEKIEALRQARIAQDVNSNRLNAEYIRLGAELDRARYARDQLIQMQADMKIRIARQKMRLKKAARYESAEGVLSRLIASMEGKP